MLSTGERFLGWTPSASLTLSAMAYEPTRGTVVLHTFREFAKTQGGVVTIAQAESHGVGYEVIRGQVAAGRWTRLHDGIYLLGNMRPAVASRRWAALLACGPGAVLSHTTAADTFAIPRWLSRSLIEISIPAERVKVSIPGIRVHRSRLLPAKATVYDGWPITSAADTVLDLIAEMRRPSDVVAILTDACRTKAVTADEILKAMGCRKRQRHRQLTKDVLGDVVGGVESNLEHTYLVRVERPHSLPIGRRQVKASAGGAKIRRDVEYDEFETVVELDGRAGHEGSGQHRDRRRDNAGTRKGKATLRYGHADLTEPCEVASEVGAVLRRNGWTGVPTPCGSRCTAGMPTT